MTYIFLVAGKGTRLHPLTLNHPKSMYKLDQNTSVLRRMVDTIRKNDSTAEIIAVVGFQAEEIQKEIPDIVYIYNPFYAVTNSIASLWFAKNYLDRDNITIINGDIVMEQRLIKTILCKPGSEPYVLVDSSIRANGDYNVQVHGNRVLVMSKDLNEYYGEYAGVTKLDRNSAEKLKKMVETMVGREMYDQWYENALVQMIFNEDFELNYKDISQYKWTEVDCVSDFLEAKKIHTQEESR